MYTGASPCEHAYMDTPDLLLPLRAAARLTGLKPENLQAEVLAGKLPAIQVGGQYLYPVNAIRQALQKRLQEAVRHD